MSSTPSGTLLIDRIPADASLVIHLGPGTELERAFARLNPEAVWLPWSAAQGVRPGSAGAVVIDGEVPASSLAAVLARALELLADGGKLLVLAPSADFHGVLAERLAGRAPPAGAQRLEAVSEAAAAAGATLVGTMALDEDVAGAQAFMARHPQVGASRPAELRLARPAARVFLLEAVRGALPQPLYIYARLRNPEIGANGAMAEVRVRRPLRFLQAIPNVRQMLEHDPMPMRPPQRPRGIFIYQRPILRRPASIELLREMIRRQYLIVMEFDDHPSYWPEIAQNDYLTFAGTHAVQTSTEPLAQVLRQFNPTVGVFRNDAAELPPPRPAHPVPTEERPLRIFYGSLNRGDSMRPLLAAVNRLLARSAVPIHVSVIADNKFHAGLHTRRKDFAQMVSHDRHREMVAQADIVLLPLADTEFNRCKSDLSFVEASARGAVVLASPIVYGASVLDGVTGMIFHSPEEFEAKLVRLVEDAALRQRIAEGAYHYVRTQRMQKDAFRTRWQWYQSLLERKDELDAALRGRIPEFRDS